jgi:hypothetical protein
MGTNEYRRAWTDFCADEPLSREKIVPKEKVSVIILPKEKEGKVSKHAVNDYVN